MICPGRKYNLTLEMTGTTQELINTLKGGLPNPDGLFQCGFLRKTFNTGNTLTNLTKEIGTNG